MLSVVFVIFTYRDDAYLLGQCLRALRMIQERLPYRTDVFVYDDEKNALPYAPRDCHYLLSNFNRNGNLNGDDCIRGELLSMKHAAKESNADIVVKVDSDVIVNNLDWCLNFDPLHSHVGFQFRNQTHQSGCCYSLPADAIFQMYQSAKTKNFGCNFPESVAMSHLSKEIGLNHVLHDCTPNNTELWRACSLLKDDIKDNKLSSHALGIMRCLDVILCELISDKRDKEMNFQLMKQYLDLK